VAAVKETSVALELLFTTDIGLLSLFTIVFIIGMAIFLFFFVRSRIREEDRQQEELNLGR
jgi:uncharacterized membrane protein YciS (DUF1049 family)